MNLRHATEGLHYDRLFRFLVSPLPVELWNGITVSESA